MSRCPRGKAEFRLNELTEFWLEAARRDGFSAKIVVAIRNPQEVFASATAASRPFRPREANVGNTSTTSIETSNAFWLKTNLLAECNSRGVPRVFVEYSNLMKGWQLEISRISEALSTDLEGIEVAITDPTRTIIDCFRYRTKVGIDVAMEGLREGLRQRKTTSDQLWRQATKARVWSTMKPYVEATVADGT